MNLRETIERVIHRAAIESENNYGWLDREAEFAIEATDALLSDPAVADAIEAAESAPVTATVTPVAGITAEGRVIEDGPPEAAAPADRGKDPESEQIGGVCEGCGVFIRTDGMVPSQHEFGHVVPGEMPDFCGPVEPVFVRRPAREGEAERA